MENYILMQRKIKKNAGLDNHAIILHNFGICVYLFKSYSANAAISLIPQKQINRTQKFI